MAKLLTGTVVEAARQITTKTGKTLTTIDVEVDGVTYHIYASGDVPHYYQHKVGDLVQIVVGSDSKARLIEPTPSPAPLGVSPQVAEFLAEQAALYRAAYETAKFTMGDLLESTEDLRAVATTLYLQAAKVGFTNPTMPVATGGCVGIDINDPPPAPRPKARQIGRRSIE